MNKNQKVLYKALESLSCALLDLEDAQNIVEKLSKEEVEEVIKKFSEKIVEFDVDELYKESSYYEGYANTILTAISGKLDIDI